MGFELTQEIRSIQEVARRFAKNEIAPRVAADDRDHRFQRDLVTRMAQLGLFGCPIPAEYGGSDSGYLAHAVVTEEIARFSGSLRAAFNMQTMATAKEICEFGTADQKGRYVSKFVSGQREGDSDGEVLCRRSRFQSRRRSAPSSGRLRVLERARGGTHVPRREAQPTARGSANILKAVIAADALGYRKANR
jgi:hypothetical protein